MQNNVSFFSYCYIVDINFPLKKKIAAIISYKSLPLRKDVKKVIHLVLHAIALILGIVGICAAFKYHNESGIANLYSLHSWLGIGIIVLYGIQVNKLFIYLTHYILSLFHFSNINYLSFLLKKKKVKPKIIRT